MCWVRSKVFPSADKTDLMQTMDHETRVVLERNLSPHERRNVDHVVVHPRQSTYEIRFKDKRVLMIDSAALIP